MSDHLTTPKADDTPELRALRLRLSILRYTAHRIERNAELRRATRKPASSPGEARRYRNRDYDAARRAKIERAAAARVILDIEAREAWREIV